MSTCTASVCARASPFWFFFYLKETPTISGYHVYLQSLEILLKTASFLFVVQSGSTLYEIQTVAVTLNNSKQSRAEGASRFPASAPAFLRAAHRWKENQALYGLQAAIARVPFWMRERACLKVVLSVFTSRRASLFPGPLLRCTHSHLEVTRRHILKRCLINSIFFFFGAETERCVMHQK